MSKAKPSQYHGKITPKQAAEGIKAATENAFDLYKEAKLLFEYGHYQRSLSLAVLAIEESGKPAIIRRILTASNDRELKDVWREYRSHTKKNLMWNFKEHVIKGARKLDDFAGIFDDKSDHGLLLDSIKQLSFYSDAYGDCHWSEPKQVIEKNLAEQILHSAKLLVKSEPSNINSEKFLSIWEKNLRLPASASSIDRKAGLLKVYQEAEDEGLIPKGEYENMKRFILSGIK